MLPYKGSAKEEINVAHKINLDVFFEFRLEVCFDIRICGVKYEVVHVDADMEGCSQGHQGIGCERPSKHARIIGGRLETKLL